MRCFGYLFVVIGLCGACAENALGALITLDQSTTLDASNTNGLDNYKIVQGPNPPTVVDILPGARLYGDRLLPALDAYDGSVVNFQGNWNEQFHSGPLRLNDTAHLNFVGGRSDSRVLVEMHDRSTAHYIDGWADEFRAYDDSFLHVSQGVFYGTEIWNRARVRFSGGFTDSLLAYDDARLIWHGGTVGAGSWFRGRSRVLLAGGNSWEDVRLDDDTVLVWRSGRISEDGALSVHGNAVAHIYGYDLRFEEDEVDGWSLIRGKFADGSNLWSRYYIHDNGRIILHEVPEPTSIALCVVTGLGLAFVHWRDRPWRFYQRFPS